ncbi:MAG: nicotinate-nucleotide adenylyltransferase [bacterium]
MARVGIVGGTFDPPHNAHLAMAEAALEGIPLETVLFMPAPRPPQKNSEDLTAYTLRLEMLRRAVAGRPGWAVSRLEEERPGPSYTVDLLASFRNRSADEPFLILGADSVSDLPKWKDPAGVLRLATLVVFPRTGYSPLVPIDGPASVVLFESPVIDVSSTEIRERIRKGAPVDSLIPTDIHEFILDNGLYT